MPRKFNEYIRPNDEGETPFVSLSTREVPVGSLVVLMNEGLMGRSVGTVFEVVDRYDCESNDPEIHRYKGIGEAYLQDMEGRSIILRGGPSILDSAFVRVIPPSNKETISNEEDILPPPPPVRAPVPVREADAVVERLVGERGPPGLPGVQGPRGLQGLRGLKGDTGDVGIGLPGPTGPQGGRGEKGLPGERGEPGQEGPQGPQGERGLYGLQGEQGSKGERGEPGPRGFDGIQGPAGEKGTTGTPGVRGECGERGSTGPQGNTGPQGPAGERGERGEKGERGERGPQGNQGDVGVSGGTGAQGPPGPVGPRGPQGAQGVTGFSGVLSAQGPLVLKNQKLTLDVPKLKSMLGSFSAFRNFSSGPGGGMGEAFKVVSVPGASDLTAVQYAAETLTIAPADSSVVLTTDPSSNTLYIQAVGGGVVTIDGGAF